MRSSLPGTKHEDGFTLIELLTVIGIISILMALLFPALNAAKNSARKGQALNDCVAIKNAVMAYKTDYGVYPLNSINAGAGTPGEGGWDTCYGDPNGTYSSAYLFDILTANGNNPNDQFNSNNQLNPRQAIYFEGKNAASATQPRGGFVTNPGGVTGPRGYQIQQGAYVDPWGMEYVVLLDANYDGTLSQAPNVSAAGWFYPPPNTPVVNSGAAVCSLGPDHAFGAAGVTPTVFYGSDDIATWQ
jgi:prepilin-type N-terminal cleavage/methylation domain-containing protein